MHHNFQFVPKYKMKKLALTILCLIICATINAQQSFIPNNPFSQYKEGVSDSISVSLITYYPGSMIYELYGHAGIKIGFANGSGILYNYGIFDFNSPNFLYRFIKGETDYMVKGYSTDYLLRGYTGRRVIEQVLNLSQRQAYYAAEYLYNEALPWNATYRYNYVLDNCSTRPRDVIELATGGTIQYPPMQDTTTFRKIMHHYNANYAWSQFGIDLALGTGLDRTITYREQMFVPMILMQACSEATFELNGQRVPLVKETIILNEGSEQGNILPPTPRWATPMCIFSILLAITITISIFDCRRKKVSRWFDTIMYGAFTLDGLLMFFLIFISTHEATSPNWNGVWINPLYILPATLVWINSAKRVLYFYHFSNFAVLFALLLSWYWIPQVAHPAFLPLILCSVVRSVNYIIISRKQNIDATQKQ